MLSQNTNSAIAVVYQYATQAKVADFIVSELADHDIRIDPIAVDSYDEIIALGSDERLFNCDLVLSTLGGRQTVALAKALRENPLSATRRRPLLGSMNVGVILNHVYYGTFLFREGADIVFVNRESDVERIRGFFASLGGTPPEIVAVRCPIFNDIRPPATTTESPRSLLYSVQTDIPRTRPERLYVIERLAEYARRYPEREVILKPKVAPGEETAHPQKFAFEELLETLEDGVPANLIVSYEPMRDLIERADVLVTFSSTAVLEALALGRRGAVLIDFGVREILGNTYFIGSGLFASFDDLLADRVPAADPKWLADELSAPPLSAIVGEIVARARSHDAEHRISSVFNRCTQLVEVVENARAASIAGAAAKLTEKARPAPPPKLVRQPGGAPLWAQADRLWRDRGEGVLFDHRLRRFEAIYEGQRHAPIHRDGAGKPRPCVLLGNGPSAARIDPASLRGAETICANWFILHDAWDEVKPDHLVIGSRVISGIDTHEPRFRRGFRKRLKSFAHSPVLWVPFSTRDLMEEIGFDKRFEINYLLYEKPFRRAVDMAGAATLDASGFLDDAHSVLLSLGIPAGIDMGFTRFALAGSEARFFKDGEPNFFHGGDKAELTPERLATLRARWHPGGRAHVAFGLVADALAARGMELVDTTEDGSLEGLPRDTLAGFLTPRPPLSHAA